MGRTLAGIAADILFFSLTACEHNPVGPTVPVKGSVKRNGEPLQSGSLVFWPDADKGNTGAFEAGAQLDKNGGFDLITRGIHAAPLGGLPRHGDGASSERREESLFQGQALGAGVLHEKGHDSLAR
jgi:hypothetical protein